MFDNDFKKSAIKMFALAIAGNIIVWGAIAGFIILILWLCHVI